MFEQTLVDEQTVVEIEQSFEPIELTASADRFSRVVDVVQTIALVAIACRLRRR